MDLMCFPLLGFMLAATQGCQFYTTIKSESDFQYMDFFDHILRVNNIPQGKMIVVGECIISFVFPNRILMHSLFF